MLSLLLLILRAAAILGGTAGGLLWSQAHPMLWMLEMPIAVLFSLTLRSRTTVVHGDEIAGNLANRTYGLLVLTLVGTTTFFSQQEYWRELVGIVGGSIIGLWGDWVQKFFRDEVTLSFSGRMVIIMKILAIMVMNNALPFFGEFIDNLWVFLVVLVFSQLFGVTLIDMVRVAITSVRGNATEEHDIEKQYLFSDIIATVGILGAVIGVHHQMEPFRGLFWVTIGLAINFSANLVFCLLLQGRDVKEDMVEIPKLTEVTIGVFPDDNKLGMSYCIAELLSQKEQH